MLTLKSVKYVSTHPIQAVHTKLSKSKLSKSTRPGAQAFYTWLVVIKTEVEVQKPAGIPVNSNHARGRLRTPLCILVSWKCVRRSRVEKIICGIERCVGN